MELLLISEPKMHPNNNSQLVVYNPYNQAPERAVVVRKVSSGSPSPRPQPGLGLRIRQDDIRQTYKVLPILIGTGSFGAVRVCLHRRSKTKLAVKSIILTAENSTLVKNEVALLQNINHRNVVRVVDVIQDRKYIHIIMEQCRGKDLFDVITDDRYRPNEGWARNVAASILDVVAYLHANHIVHRDLKVRSLRCVLCVRLLFRGSLMRISHSYPLPISLEYSQSISYSKPKMLTRQSR